MSAGSSVLAGPDFLRDERVKTRTGSGDLADVSRNGCEDGFLPKSGQSGSTTDTINAKIYCTTELSLTQTSSK